MPINVRLETFEGPVDLLLALVRKHEVPIEDVPLALITRQYLEYMAMMERLDLEVAGDFILIAATLIYMKARRLVAPDDEETPSEEEAADELMERLKEFEPIREAALALGEREMLGRDVYSRPGEEDEERGAIDLESLNLFYLAKAFFDLMESLGPEAFHQIEAEAVSVEEKMDEIRRRLKGAEGSDLQALLNEPLNRQELIVTFLALLELVRLKAISLLQPQPLGPILIFPSPKLFEEVPH